MTVAAPARMRAVADAVERRRAARLVLAPSAPPPDDRATVTATVTLQVQVDGDVREPAAVARAVLDHLAAACESTVLPLPRLVDSAPPDPDPRDGSVQVDVAAHAVTYDGRAVDLCRREFELLQFLAERPRQVFTRSQLLAAIWADSFTGERTVDVHVSRLRGKLSGREELITTVRGVGYRLADGAPVVVVNG